MHVCLMVVELNLSKASFSILKLLSVNMVWDPKCWGSSAALTAARSAVSDRCPVWGRMPNRMLRQSKFLGCCGMCPIWGGAGGGGGFTHTRCRAHALH